jgi:hypothetical protein
MFVFVLATWASAAQLVVSPGDDLAALTTSLGPGDEVVFNEGLYFVDGTLDWSHVGTETEPIRLVAATAGSVVIELASGGAVVSMSGARFVEVRGLTLQGVEGLNADGFAVYDGEDLVFESNVLRGLGDEGFDLEGFNQRITIRGNEIAESTGGMGVQLGCDDATCATSESVVSGNWIHGLESSGAWGIYLANGCTGVTVSDNVVHDVVGGGILAASTEHGDAHIIERNAVWSIGSEEVTGRGIALSGAAIVQNNLVFQVTGDGVWTGSASTLEGLVVSFNTVADTGGYGLYLSEPWAGLPGMVLANNAINNATGYGARAPDEAFDAGNRVVGNRITGLVDGLEGGFEAGGGALDFVDAAGFDFYPSDVSTLRDVADPAADSWVPALDFNSSPRDGAAPDVGAYEYVGATNPGWLPAPGFKGTAVVDGVVGAEVGGCGGNKSMIFAPLLLLLRRRPPRGRDAGS